MRRRALIAAGGVAAVTVSLGLGALVDPFTTATGGRGDPGLIDAVVGWGRLSSRSFAVAMVDAGRVRQAVWRCDARTVFELGSVSKPLTGLVLADSVARGEVALDAPIARYLDLAGCPAGEATVLQVATHTSGLPRGGHAGTPGQWWTSYGGPVSTLLADARSAQLDDAGFSYSNLGGALAGQLIAAATKTTYPDLMTSRLFGPLGMPLSASQTGRVLAPGGWRNGRPAPPFVLDGYAPMGALVSTLGDMTTLMLGLLSGTAPGTAALNPYADYAPDRSEGLLWTVVTDPQPSIALHPGGTPGYAAYLAVSRGLGRAVVVLSDTAGTNVSAIGETLMSSPPH